LHKLIGVRPTAARSALRIRQAAFIAAALAAATVPSHADDKPLWEFGLGAGVLALNDYRGADTTHVYLLPVPYFVYRGTLLKSDREGLRGLLVNQQRVELNLSVSATPPARSDAARTGMPDLRATFEVGPQLNVHLWRSTAEHLKLDLRVPARAAFTFEAIPHYVGVFVAPNLGLDIAQHGGEYGWKLGLLAGPLFATRRYDDYFYTVAPQYATAARPAYQASGGYAGSQILASLSRRYPSFWIGAYVRHDTLAGASFAASPLVERDSYWSTGFAVMWMIRQSTRLVESEE
jgi:outer membrane protein